VIVALAAHQCEEVTTVYFNDEALTLDGSGNVTSPAKYVGFARVETQLGTAAQTADADLVSESPRWTTNHRLRGICYVYVRFKWSAEVFPSGRPNISALVKGKLVYDPRTTTTAYSANWALCLGDYLMDTEFGLSVALDQINDTAWQAAANVADENVTLTDSHDRKTIYVQRTNRKRRCSTGDAIEQITNAGAGFIGRIGGSNGSFTRARIARRQLRSTKTTFEDQSSNPDEGQQGRDIQRRERRIYFAGQRLAGR
jgi:hypothetical protein